MQDDSNTGVRKARDLVKVASEHLLTEVEIAISDGDRRHALDELGMTMTVLEEAVTELDEIS